MEDKTKEGMGARGVDMLAALRAAESEIEYLLTKSRLVQPDHDRHRALLVRLRFHSREYAAQIANCDWPSEEDVSKACVAYFDALPVGGSVNADPVAMRAALQSVRPPAGVVSDEDVERCVNERMDNGDPVHQWLIFGSDGPEPLIRTILESYASRHALNAPTKD